VGASKAWVVRAGSSGEHENRALDESVVVVGWPELGDLSSCRSPEDLRELLARTYPDSPSRTIANWVGQLWTFLGKIQIGDLVVLPLKGQPVIAIGRVMGDYRYRTDFPEGAQHTRPVNWLATEVPRLATGEDLRRSLNANLTVYQLTNAYERLSALAQGATDPGSSTAPAVATEGDADLPVTETDLEQQAKDEIMARIRQRFPGHKLSQLVAAIFQAKGMTTFVAPDGKDGGIDVLAGAGPLGMDSPRVCVQVKFTQAAADVNVVRQAQGVAGEIGADHVLVVSWNGVTRDALRELWQKKFFRVRLWTADDILRELTAVYDRLPEEIQTELPLKRVWLLTSTG
jgi:restriction system protein